MYDIALTRWPDTEMRELNVGKSHLGNAQTDQHLGTKLLEAAIRTPSADNSQPWRFVLSSERLDVEFVERAHERKVFSALSSPVLLAIGAMQESMQQVAHRLDLEIEWGAPSSASKLLAVKSRLNFSDVCALPPDEPVLLRHTNRAPYQATSLPPSCISSISNAHLGRARVALIKDAERRRKVASIFRTCSEARFQIRELHEWLVGNLRFSREEVARGDGLDIRSLELPIGAVQFLRFSRPWSRMSVLNRLKVFKIMAAMDSQPIAHGPALIAIIAPRDAIKDAGSLMARVWIELNRQGIAVHPYFALTDLAERLHENKIPFNLSEPVAAAVAAVPRVFDTGPDEFVQIILRVGYPTKSPVVRSKRLAYDQLVFTSQSE